MINCKNYMKKITTILLLLVLGLSSCEKPDVYEYVVECHYCSGETKTLTVRGYDTGLYIYNYNKAVPELRVEGKGWNNGWWVALNVCNFKIISQNKVQ